MPDGHKDCDKWEQPPDLVYLAAMEDRAVRMAVIARRRNARTLRGPKKHGQRSSTRPITLLSLIEADPRGTEFPELSPELAAKVERQLRKNA